jgi:hypothetical protein
MPIAQASVGDPCPNMLAQTSERNSPRQVPHHQATTAHSSMHTGLNRPAQGVEAPVVKATGGGVADAAAIKFQVSTATRRHAGKSNLLLRMN